MSEGGAGLMQICAGVYAWHQKKKYEYYINGESLNTDVCNLCDEDNLKVMFMYHSCVICTRAG